MEDNWINNQPDWNNAAEKQAPEDNKCAHAGCWADGEMTGYARCMVNIVIPMYKKILAARDAHVEGDYDEVYHQLYLMASPNVDKLEPWAEMEAIVQRFLPLTPSLYEHKDRE